MQQVNPPDGYSIPAIFREVGPRLVAAGAIDMTKFTNLYEQQGKPLTDEQVAILTKGTDKNIIINPENAYFLLNFLWALGLANENAVLTEGPMMARGKEKVGSFASTGGWTLASGDSMQHYSRHRFVDLTAEQQVVVDRVSRNIYRPCCGNSTHFPDCNHGMAMLGLLELMASQGVNEQDMYKYALIVNSYWFPDTYLTIAKFKESQSTDWKQVNPQEVLGAEFSSAQGYQQVRGRVEPVAPKSGGGCGV
jgi:hypothetical protein